MRELNDKETQIVSGAGFLTGIVDLVGGATSVFASGVAMTGRGVISLGLNSIYTTYLVGRIIGAVVSFDSDKVDAAIKKLTDFYTPKKVGEELAE